jgi:hypothetical protein
LQMEEGLTLNLDLEELGAARRGPKLTWKEKKQLVRGAISAALPPA